VKRRLFLLETPANTDDPKMVLLLSRYANFSLSVCYCNHDLGHPQEFSFGESRKGPSKALKELEERQNKNLTFQPKTNRHHPQLGSPVSVGTNPSPPASSVGTFAPKRNNFM
jgi:hypothetical protein